MNLKQLFVISTLTLATGAVFAADSITSPLTRAEVHQSVLLARANGTLIPAGEGNSPLASEPQASTSALSRADVEDSVVQARADDMLVPAGEISPQQQTAYRMALARPSTLTRAEVRHEVIVARADHTLLPAGEADAINPAQNDGMSVFAATAPRTVALAGR